MILANLRARLTASDHQVVSDLLARHSSKDYRGLVRERGPDALLDAPELPELLRNAPGFLAPSAALFMYVSVRQSLLSTGLEDVRLADYLGALLLEFGMRDRAQRIMSHDDETYRYLADIVAHAQESPGRRGFLLRVHLGNYSLWLAGVFPDHVTWRRERRGGPGFSYYEALGARGFREASDDRLAHELELADIYARVAEAFPAIRVALNRLSDQAFFRAVSTPDRLIRQVQDDARFPQPEGS